MEQRAIRLGIIGAGLAVKLLHWPPLSKLRNELEVVVVCDIEPKAAQEVAALVGGCRITTDYHDVLVADDVEAVLISLPIHLTAQFIFEAVQAGKHVICEKPLAANLEQGQDLLKKLQVFAPGAEKGRTSGEKGIVVEIAENYHYRQDIKTAKELIAAGRIGNPFLVEITAYFWTDHEEGYSSTPWRQDNQYRGGVIADAAVHQVAALRELGGSVEQVQAFTKSIHPVMGGLDTIIMNLRYRSGVLGHLTFAGAAKGVLGPFTTMLVYGTEGTLSITDGTVTLKGHKTEAEVFTDPEHDGGYLAEFRNFYQAIVEGAPVVGTLEEAYKDWELVMRALDSAESRQVILLT